MSHGWKDDPYVSGPGIVHQVKARGDSYGKRKLSSRPICPHRFRHALVRDFDRKFGLKERRRSLPPTVRLRREIRSATYFAIFSRVSSVPAVGS